MKQIVLFLLFFFGAVGVVNAETIDEERCGKLGEKCCVPSYKAPCEYPLQCREGSCYVVHYECKENGIANCKEEFVELVLPPYCYGDDVKCWPDRGNCEYYCKCGVVGGPCCWAGDDKNQFCINKLKCNRDYKRCEGEPTVTPEPTAIITETPSCKACKKIADYNCDGDVNGLDYSWWKQEYVDKLQHDGRWQASSTCSETVSLEDFSAWRNSYLN